MSTGSPSSLYSDFLTSEYTASATKKSTIAIQNTVKLKKFKKKT